MNNESSNTLWSDIIFEHEYTLTWELKPNLQMLACLWSSGAICPGLPWGHEIVCRKPLGKVQTINVDHICIIKSSDMDMAILAIQYCEIIYRLWKIWTRKISQHPIWIHNERLQEEEKTLNDVHCMYNSMHFVFQQIRNSFWKWGTKLE